MSYFSIYVICVALHWAYFFFINPLEKEYSRIISLMGAFVMALIFPLYWILFFLGWVKRARQNNH